METTIDEKKNQNDYTPLENLNSLVGFYVHPTSNDALDIRLENDTLIFNAGPGYKLSQTGENNFMLEGTTATLELIPASVDNAGTARFTPDGDLYFKRDPWKPEVSELADYTGTYYSPELGTEYQFELVESSLMFRHRKMDSSKMEPLFENAFKLDNATLTFDDDLSGFKLSDGRVWNVIFEKVSGD
jgi:hypothetical protein